MAFTKVEAPGIKINKRISIRPFFDNTSENMGLENYDMSLYEGVYHTEQLACLERNGIKRYLTGLNEFAPEIKLIANKEEKAAKIREIRTIVAELETDLAANVIDIDDPEFWNKVQLLKPDNDEFWSQIELKAGNETGFLDPAKDPYDLIKICAIDAGGFTLIAKSLKEAQTMAKPPKFYLDRHEETMTTKNAYKKIRNRALVALQNFYDKESNKLFYITKVLEPASVQYKKSTSNDSLYEAMDEYINGNSGESNKKIAAQTFLDTSKQPVGELKIRAIIKDAVAYKFITIKADGYIYHTATSSMLGKNASDIAEYLKNPLNEEVLGAIQSSVEAEWNK